MAVPELSATGVCGVPSIVNVTVPLGVPAPGATADFGVVVEGPRILEVGASASLRAAYRDADRVGGAEFVMLPGMVNSHDHGRGRDEEKVAEPIGVVALLVGGGRVAHQDADRGVDIGQASAADVILHGSLSGA